MEQNEHFLRQHWPKGFKFSDFSRLFQLSVTNHQIFKLLTLIRRATAGQLDNFCLIPRTYKFTCICLRSGFNDSNWFVSWYYFGLILICFDDNNLLIVFKFTSFNGTEREDRNIIICFSVRN